MRIEMDFDGTLVQGTLNETETAKAFYEALPLSIRVGSSGMDFCGHIDQGFPYEDAQVGFGWRNGDINYNPGGGWLAIFYAGEEQSQAYDDQVNIGKLDPEAIGVLENLNGSYDITVRRHSR